MGKGIFIKCKSCGHEWSHKTGEGILGPAQNDDDTTIVLTPSGEEVDAIKCPECGSVEADVTSTFLWD